MLNLIIKKIPNNINLYIISKCDQFNYLLVFGWLGFIKYKFKKLVSISIKYKRLRLQGKKALFYTYLKLIHNFYSWTMHINKKLLLLQGVGFKFKLLLNKLCLVLGYSHIIKLSFSNNIKVSLISNKLIELNALNLYSLNYYIYTIKKFKKLDVYKGKGILLGGEEVLKKEGKKATF